MYILYVIQTKTPQNRLLIKKFNILNTFNVNRIKNAIKKNKETFKKRIYTNFEIKTCEKRKSQIECFAKRFAAKEAFVKALGLGFRDNINFNDIEILNNKKGKPFLSMSNKLKSYIIIKCNIKNYKVFFIK